MKLERVISAGIIGCVVVLALVWLAGYFAGADADLVALTAATVFGRVAAGTWIAGFAIQLVLAFVASAVYAALFEWVTLRSGLLIGLVIGIPHAVVAGLAVGFLPGDRLLGAGIAPPGAFFEYRGVWCLVAFIAAHLIFGCIVGAMYGATRHAAPTVRRTWTEVARQ
jgi:magnesium-transporting ATPase (P-type)